MNRVVETAYIGLGSNMGDRISQLANALSLLKMTAGVKVVKVSPFYETKPVGYADQPYFLNCAAEIQATLSPFELLQVCQSIEKKLKRVRKIRWGPRTVDLDILFYGDKVIDDEILKIPHPRIQERGFVLKPLMDIAPGLIHPVLKATISELYAKFAESTDEAKDIVLYEGDMN
ncbi:MAG: 2-amino-4-hydroxy-6-hydroxymethyldihydropteridine diphosphokinase [Saccharofermentanales bacterium]